MRNAYVKTTHTLGTCCNFKMASDAHALHINVAANGTPLFCTFALEIRRKNQSAQSTHGVQQRRWHVRDEHENDEVRMFAQARCVRQGKQCSERSLSTFKSEVLAVFVFVVVVVAVGTHLTR